MRIYLAGPMHGRTDEDVHGWRNRVKACLSSIHFFSDPSDRDHRGLEHLPAVAASVVEEDKREIGRSDLLLVRMDKPGVGTSMEVLYAWQLGIPVWLVLTEPTCSPWLSQHANRIFDRLEDAIEDLKYVRK